MHHADFIAHQHLSNRRVNRNDAYCNAAKATLVKLNAQRTVRRRIVAVLAVVDVICIIAAFSAALGAI